MRSIRRLLVAVAVAFTLSAFTSAPAGASPICVGAGVEPYSVTVCTP